jgi:hypothetical protein
MKNEEWERARSLCRFLILHFSFEILHSISSSLIDPKEEDHAC